MCAALLAACGGGSSGSTPDGTPDGSSVDGRAIDGPPVDGTVADARPVSDAIPGCSLPDPYTPPTPAEVGIPAGMAVWLRADMGVSRDTDGLVCEIDDLSGNGHDFTQLSAGARPSVATIGLQPAIEYTGGKSMTRLDVMGLSPTATRTIFAVVQLDVTDARSTFIHQGTLANNHTDLGPEANTFNSAGNLWGLYMTGNAYDSQIAATTDPSIIVWKIDSMTIGQPILDHLSGRVSGLDMTLTRTPAGSGDGNIEDFTAADQSFFGYSNPDQDYQIAEAILYGRTLTAREVGQVEAYLSARYGIALAD